MEPLPPLNLSITPSATSAASVNSEIGSPMYFGSSGGVSYLSWMLAGGLALWLLLKR
jgi:hypothetical protein